MRSSILFLVLLSFCSCTQTRHIDEYAEMRGITNLYVSQSIIRMANVKHNPDFNKFLKPMKGAEIYWNRLDSMESLELPDPKALLIKDGYELLMESRFKDMGKFSIYDNDENFAIVGRFESAPVLIITRGKPNQEYISALSDMEAGGFEDLIKMGGPFSARNWD